MKKTKQQRKSRKGEKHEKPLSLYPLSFGDAVGKLLTTKRPPKKKNRDTKEENS